MPLSMRNAALAMSLAVLLAGTAAAHAQDSMKSKPGDAMKTDTMAPKGKDAMKSDKMGKDAMGKDAMGSDPMKKDSMGSDAMGKKTNDPMSQKKM